MYKYLRHQMSLNVQIFTYIIMSMLCVSEHKGNVNDLFFILAIGLTGNQNTYGAGSTAAVICYSNFTVTSIKWIASSNISYSTKMIKMNEMLIMINNITQDNNGVMIICEVSNLLSSGDVTASNTTFTISILDECKLIIFKETIFHVFCSFSVTSDHQPSIVYAC